MELFIPEWLNETDPRVYSNAKAGGGRFLVKSLRSLNSIMVDDLTAEKWARQEGLLQALSADYKIAGCIIMLVALSLMRDYRLLLALWGVSLALMMASRLPVLTLQKRIWGIIPLITVIVTLPAALNLVSDGTPLLILYQGSVNGPAALANPIFITRQGMQAVTILFLRSGISLSMVALLVMTTKVSGLFKSLQSIGIPAHFTFIVEMSYRYLIMLLKISIEMYEARRMRTVGRLTYRQQAALLGSSLGFLFAQSMQLSSEVFQAMTARCYSIERFRDTYAADMLSDSFTPMTPGQLLIDRSK
jgi:cobalt/nickel transport system permease protein